MTGSSTRRTRFSSECAVIARTLGGQDRTALGVAEEKALAEAVVYVTAELPRLLNRKAERAIRDPEDLAQEALARFISAVGKGQVDPDRSPAGYLLTIAANHLRDEHRGAPAPVPFADLGPVLDSGAGSAAWPSETDAISLLIEGMSTADSVRKALARAHREGDLIVLDVVGAWLDLAQRLGSRPSQRAVAELTGVSKTTVGAVLERFERFFSATD